MILIKMIGRMLDRGSMMLDILINWKIIMGVRDLEIVIIEKVIWS